MLTINTTVEILAPGLTSRRRRGMFRGTRAALVASVAAMSISLAACGSSSDDQSTASGSGAANASAVSEGSEFAAPKAFLEKSLKNPSGIGYDEALPSKPPTGKLIVAMETP